MLIQSIYISDSWVNFYGNIGKTLLSLVSNLSVVQYHFLLILAIFLPFWAHNHQYAFYWRTVFWNKHNFMTIMFTSYSSLFLLALILRWYIMQISVFFDLVFMCQHFILYPGNKAHISTKPNKEGAEPLIKSPDDPTSENV